MTDQQDPQPPAAPSGWGQQPQWGGQPTWGGQQPQPGHGPGYGPPPGYGATLARPRPGIVPLRPLGLGEILDGAFQAIRTNPRTMLGISALVMVVVTTIGLVPQFYLMLQLRGLSAIDQQAAQFEDLTGPLLSSLGGLILTTTIKALATTVLSGLLVVAVGEAVIGRRIAPRALWTRVRSRVPAVIGVSLLSLLIPGAAMIVGIGAALGVGYAGVTAGAPEVAMALVGITLGAAGFVAALWLAMQFALAGPAMLLEQIGVRAALRRSWRLVRGSWWRVFGILMLASIIAGFGAGIVSVPFSQGGSLITLSGDPSTPQALRVLLGTAIGGIGEIIGGTVMTPFSAAVTSLLYIDRRMRSEGLDIELGRAAQAAAAPPAG